MFFNKLKQHIPMLLLNLVCLFLLIIISSNPQAYYFLNLLKFELSNNYSFSAFSISKGTLVLLILYSIQHTALKILKNSLNTLGSIPEDSKNYIYKIAKATMFTFSAIVILYVTGIDITTLTIFGGAIGIGIGLGLQKITGNLLYGLTIFATSKFKNGDIVELQGSSGVPAGTVKRVGLTYTIIEQFNGTNIMVPNDIIGSTYVTNWSYKNSKYRLSIIIPIDYDQDLEKAKDVILNLVKDLEFYTPYPAPRCLINEFKATHIELCLYVFMTNIQYGYYKAMDMVTLKIYKELKKANIRVGLDYEKISSIGLGKIGEIN